MKPSQNLLSWQVFVATCRTRSISQAAVLLDIDLPKASRLLSALETELGEPLFDKSHRPIQPTLVRQNCSVLSNRWSQDFRLP